MSIRKMNEGVSSWNSKTPFPKDRYTIACIEESMAPSRSSGSVMLTRTWEIVAPEIVACGDRDMNVAGLKITQFVITKVKNKETGEWDVEKSDKAFGRFRDELLLMGFDPEGEVDDENPPLFMLNKVADAIVYAKEDVARKAPTPEQIRKGQRVGDAIKDANNKDVKTYTLQIESILGKSDMEVAF